MSRPRRRGIVWALALAALGAVSGAEAANPKPARAQRAAAAVPPVRLVYHVEDAAGQVLASDGGEEPFNPASVVKAATTLWAVERLGPEHRFETRFAMRGTLDAQHGRLLGDLVVLGGGDPDFHFENAYLVARALAAQGVREVSGALLVSDGFWIGWEGGSERREQDPDRRGRGMAARLAHAFDSRRWTEDERRWIRDVERRHGLAPGAPAQITVRGAVGRLVGPAGDVQDLVVHRSNRLADVLKRLTSYSNNDIERLEWTLGSAQELSEWLARRWDVAPSEISLSTLSGLGSNRLSSRLGVRLLRDLHETSHRHGLDLADLLPLAGCDPGTLKLFPRLVRGKNSRSVVAKTGTLTSTDGGVSVLAGLASTADGERWFCVAAPEVGQLIWAARKAEEQWVVDLLAGNGGAQPMACGPRAPLPDAGVEIVPGGDRSMGADPFTGL